MGFPLGTHRVRAVDCALGTASTGTEQIGILFENLETKERITWYGYFTDAAIERTVESLRHLGWTGVDLMDFAEGLPAGVDQEVEIVVEDEQDNRDGTLKRKVKWVNSAGGGVAVKNRLDGNAAKVFAAKMKGKIAGLQNAAGVLNKPAASRPAASKAAQAQGRAVAAGVSASVNRPMEEEPQGFVEDDIPF